MTKEEIETMCEKAKASCTTIDTMRDFVVTACDEMLEKRSLSVYYRVEDFLFGSGKNKPIEIQAAIIWGALLVVHHEGYIEWSAALEIFGEFMSKKMDLR